MSVLREQNTIQVTISSHKGQSSMSLNEKAQESVSRLQVLEQNLQAVNSQKQQFQAQQFEIDGALKEVKSTEKAFKIVGGVMIESSKDELQKELEGKKELLDLRVQTLEKQEKQLKEKAKGLREEVMKQTKK